MSWFKKKQPAVNPQITINAAQYKLNGDHLALFKDLSLMVTNLEQRLTVSEEKLKRILGE